MRKTENQSLFKYFPENIYKNEFYVQIKFSK